LAIKIQTLLCLYLKLHGLHMFSRFVTWTKSRGCFSSFFPSKNNLVAGCFNPFFFLII
jgi:hypothetical protein